MSSLAMSGAANQAALAALAGLNQYQPATSKVLDRQVEALSQKLAAALFECAAACKQRKELQNKFCDLKEADERTIAGLQEKLKKAEERLFTCQVEVIRFHQAVDAKLADVQRRDQQHHQQVSALLAENVLLKEQANKVQLLLKEQTCKTEELEKKLALQEQAAEAELSTVWKLVKYYQQQISDLEAEVLVWEGKQDKMKLLLQEQNYKIEDLEKKLARQAQAHQPTLLQFSSAKPPRWQPGHLVKQVQELTQEVEVKQQLISELQDELAEMEFELSAMSTSTWGFDTPSSDSSTGAVKHTASVATQTALEICCDSEFEEEEEEEEQDAVQSQQAQVQVVLNLEVSAVEEGKLQALNSNLQQQLVVYQQLACQQDKDLAAMRVRSQQLEKQSKHLEQMVFDLTEKLVELEQRPEVSLVIHVDDEKEVKDAGVQGVVALAISINAQGEVDDLRDEIAAVASRHQQEVEAVEVINKQLQEQVNALQYLVAEKDDKIQELQQRPQVTLTVSRVDGHHSEMMVDQVVQQMAGLKQQVSVLMHSKQYLEAELVNRSRHAVQVQQQLTAAMQTLRELQMAAAPAPTPAAVKSSANTDAIIAALEHLTVLRVKNGSSSSSKSLQHLKRKFTADRSSSSQPGTPGTPALSHPDSFAVGRGSSSSSSSSNDDVEFSDDGYEVDGSVFAADHIAFNSDSDSTALMIPSDKLKQPRHRALVNSIQHRLKGSFTCLRNNSSNMVKKF